jgi:hypothetical protein
MKATAENLIEAVSKRFLGTTTTTMDPDSDPEPYVSEEAPRRQHVYSDLPSRPAWMREGSGSAPSSQESSQEQVQQFSQQSTDLNPASSFNSQLRSQENSDYALTPPQRIPPPADVDLHDYDMEEEQSGKGE